MTGHREAPWPIHLFRLIVKPLVFFLSVFRMMCRKITWPALVETMDRLNLRHLLDACSGRGSKASPPALEKIAPLPDSLGKVDTAVVDTGYFRKVNVEDRQEAGIHPLIPEKRRSHNLPLEKRSNQDPGT